MSKLLCNVLKILGEANAPNAPPWLRAWLQCLHAYIRWESTHIGWSRTCSIGFIFSYKIIARVIYSGVLKGRHVRHLLRATLCNCNMKSTLLSKGPNSNCNV